MTTAAEAPSAPAAEPAKPLLDTFRYDDGIVRLFAFATIFWGIVGFSAGVFIALQLAGMGSLWGPTWLNAEWLGFGRLRPLHTNAVIFAFTGNGIFAGVYYSLQRLLRARMWSDRISQFHFWSWQTVIVLAAITLPLGITTSKEYAELEWPIDILLALSWIAFGINMFGTIAKRRERHLYVAIWFYIATWVGITMLHVGNSLAMPVSLIQSYPIYAGVQDALVQWWYGHNAVAFFLTTPILGLMYYYVPKAAERPVYSYRLSIFHFWALIFIYIWAGPHHLLHSSLPQWAQSLATTFSIMLLAPSWGGMVNGLLTLRGAFDKVRRDPVLKFFVLSITAYGMATFEGPLLSLREVNALSHNTDWTIGHVHSGALGWVGFLCMGMIYWLVPRLWKTRLYSIGLANFHFWIGTVGIALYAITMWITGIAQANMWFQFNEYGKLVYNDWIEMITNFIPFYWARAFGGALFLVGAVLMVYNLWRTMRDSDERCTDETVQAPPLRPEPDYNQQIADAAKTPGDIGRKTNALHELIERWPTLLTVLTVVALAIGGIAEIIPNMIQGALTPKIESVKPYTPLELAGRDIYIAEGCVSCHTQLVRTLRADTERYEGEYTRAGEHVYDRPFLWGSKRTGPDLAREGISRAGAAGAKWHWDHMYDPQSTSAGSIMPAYQHLYDEDIDYAGLSDKLRVLARAPLFHPYTKQEIRDADLLAREQAELIADMLRSQLPQVSDAPDQVEQVDEELVPYEERAWSDEHTDRKIIALIAYLLRLGTDLER
ncbi:MAG: cytochrome-c oxidase, cbb3-type subunit I [Planctomycetota bacterium]